MTDYFDEKTIIQQFFSHMQELGITPKCDFYPITDGQTHRFSVAGDRAGERSGAYYIHSDGMVNWGIQDFHKHGDFQKRKLDKSFMNESGRKSLKDRAAIQKRIEESQANARRKAQEDKELQQRLIARAWQEFQDTTDRYAYISPYEMHPYLKLKQCSDIANHHFYPLQLSIKTKSLTGDKAQIGDLIVPLVRADNLEFRSFVHIPAKPNEDGKFGKLYYHGIHTQGLCYPLLDTQFAWIYAPEDYKPPKPCGGNFWNKDSELILAEGIATGLSLVEALKKPIYCCMTCHNIIHVARLLRERWPNMKIIIAADNDDAGLRAAHETLKAGFADKINPAPIKGQDWNDYLNSKRQGATTNA